MYFAGYHRADHNSTTKCTSLHTLNLTAWAELGRGDRSYLQGQKHGLESATIKILQNADCLDDEVRRITEKDLGLKVLYRPPEETPIKYEIIAVHGIGAHPDDTWCKTIKRDGNERQVNWLADKEMLPAVLPDARIMRFGAKTQWFGDYSIKTSTSDVAELLLNALCRDRKDTDSKARPLIFIAHCFGGLAVMKALLAAANSVSERHIFDSVTGIAFMGTPFRGAEQVGQKEMIGGAREVYRDVHPGILRITEPSDEMLNEIVNGFIQKRDESQAAVQLVCFYELELCDVMAVVDKTTANHKTIRVDKSSGCLDGAKKIPLQRNHFNMNKFGGPDEETYKIVQDEIVKMANGLNPSAQHDDGKPHCNDPPEPAQIPYNQPRVAPISIILWSTASTVNPESGDVIAPRILWNVGTQVKPDHKASTTLQSSQSFDDKFLPIVHLQFMTTHENGDQPRQEDNNDHINPEPRRSRRLTTQDEPSTNQSKVGRSKRRANSKQNETSPNRYRGRSRGSKSPRN
ncbi:hypothetical protein EKO27_g7911 [Xylaria grammica]|uniref:DUF676 domain-containing protein n=1 Tax=Xylaria grammica TaxID=363999 RepID=A0A439CYT8_9PEZI|nr:hypothetical protein EKO27_g7911 [Xylaria grammica]